MTMRLAPDDIVIRHGGSAVRLRPSLRAAFRLQRRYGLVNLAKAIAEGHLEIIGEIIAETSDSLDARRLLMAQVDANGVRDLKHLADPLTELVCACFGIVENEEHPAERRERHGNRFSIDDALSELFGIATGWLGWSATDSLAATPEQITIAYKAHVAKLKSIHGSADTSEDDTASDYDPREEISPEAVRENIARLRDLTRAAR
jgi:hypothetical protein